MSNPLMPSYWGKTLDNLPEKRRSWLPMVINSLHPEVMGTYLYDDGESHAHTITISSARCGHLDTVIRTMAHEMIHASRWNTVTHAWTKHDKTFRNRAKAVANELGFDPLEL